MDADHGAASDEMHRERQTAPQQPYTMREIGIGALIAAVGGCVAFGIPILTTL